MGKSPLSWLYFILHCLFGEKTLLISAQTSAHNLFDVALPLEVALCFHPHFRGDTEFSYDTF